MFKIFLKIIQKLLLYLKIEVDKSTGCFKKYFIISNSFGWKYTIFYQFYFVGGNTSNSWCYNDDI